MLHAVDGYAQYAGYEIDQVQRRAVLVHSSLSQLVQPGAVDEIVATLARDRRECAAHQDEFDLVDVMPEPIQLLNASMHLQIRVAARKNSSHRRRLVPVCGCREYSKSGRARLGSRR